MIRSIANIMKNSGCDVPEWILNIEKAPYVTRPSPIQHLLFVLSLSFSFSFS